MDYRICRFCEKHAQCDALVHYSTRSYAHPVCIFARKGEPGLAALHPWQIDKLPVIALVRAGFATHETALERFAALRQSAVERETAARAEYALRHSRTVA